MSRQSNIVVFTGENTVFLERDVQAWISLFISKHGDVNLSQLHRDTITEAHIQTELVTPGFFGGYRMLVLRHIPASGAEK